MSEKKDQWLNGNLALSKLIHVRMKKKNKEGVEIEGLFIPIELNKLVESTFDTQNGKITEIQMPISVLVRPESDSKGQDGFVAKRISNDLRKASTPEQLADYKATVEPILGNLKDFSRGGSQNVSTGDANNGKTVDENDDLPF